MDTINNNFFSTPLLRILNGSDLNEVGLQIFLLQLFYRKLIFFFKQSCLKFTTTGYTLARKHEIPIPAQFVCLNNTRSSK